MSATWHGRPVVVKVVFDEQDYWMARNVFEAGRLEGIAEVLEVGEWLDESDPSFRSREWVDPEPFGVVIQERAWTPAQIQGARGPFSDEEAARLIRAVTALDAGRWSAGRRDPFYQDLDVGLDELFRILGMEGFSPVAADLHVHNVGLVKRDGHAEAVLIDLGVVQGS